MKEGLQISVAAPGETLIAAIANVIVAAFQYAGTVRTTMSAANRDELDALNNRLYRRFVDLTDHQAPAKNSEAQ